MNWHQVESFVEQAHAVVTAHIIVDGVTTTVKFLPDSVGDFTCVRNSDGKLLAAGELGTEAQDEVDEFFGLISEKWTVTEGPGIA